MVSQLFHKMSSLQNSSWAMTLNSLSLTSNQRSISWFAILLPQSMHVRLMGLLRVKVLGSSVVTSVWSHECVGRYCFVNAVWFWLKWWHRWSSLTRLWGRITFWTVKNIWTFYFPIRELIFFAHVINFKVNIFSFLHFVFNHEQFRLLIFSS